MVAASPLTIQQSAVLDFIKEFIAHNRVSPTLQEIADHLGVTRVTIFEHVGAMIRKGILVRAARHASRSLRVAETCPACGRPQEQDDKPYLHLKLKKCTRFLRGLSNTLPPRHSLQIDRFLDQLEADDTFN